MSDEKPSGLFAALAALQGELPHIDKSNVGDIPGKDGKRGYKYKYADLADVSRAILPLLSKHGLAFNSKPTIVDGEFGLLYKLVHKSGEKDEGFYPFGRGGSPQQVGSLITYARRYTLCAVTGAAPDEDDDAAAAEQPYRQSAGDVFENAAPAQAHQASNGAPRGQVARPAAAQAPATAPEDAELDEAAQEYANDAHGAQTLREVEDIHKKAREAGKIGAFIRSPSSGKVGKLAIYIDWKRKQLKDVEDAWRELNDAIGRHRIDIGEMEIQLKRKTGADPESATPAQIREFIASLDGAAA